MIYAKKEVGPKFLICSFIREIKIWERSHSESLFIDIYDLQVLFSRILWSIKAILDTSWKFQRLCAIWSWHFVSEMSKQRTGYLNNCSENLGKNCFYFKKGRFGSLILFSKFNTNPSNRLYCFYSDSFCTQNIQVRIEVNLCVLHLLRVKNETKKAICSLMCWWIMMISATW